MKVDKQTINFCLRMLIAVVYLAVISIIVFIFHKDIFNISTPPVSPAVFWQLLWCFISGLIGFSAVVIINGIKEYKSKIQLQNPFPSFIIYYPLWIGIYSIITATIFRLIIEQIGYLFYPLSFITMFYLGFRKPDYLENYFDYVMNNYILKLTK